MEKSRRRFGSLFAPRFLARGLAGQIVQPRCPGRSRFRLHEERTLRSYGSESNTTVPLRVPISLMRGDPGMTFFDSSRTVPSPLAPSKRPKPPVNLMETTASKRNGKNRMHTKSSPSRVSSRAMLRTERSLKVATMLFSLSWVGISLRFAPSKQPSKFAALLFITLNREDFSFVIHLDRQPRTSRRREAQTGSRARSGSRSERTLDAVEHSRTLMEWWPFLIFHRGGLRIKVINNRRSPRLLG